MQDEAGIGVVQPVRAGCLAYLIVSGLSLVVAYLEAGIAARAVAACQGFFDASDGVGALGELVIGGCLLTVASCAVIFGSLMAGSRLRWSRTATVVVAVAAVPIAWAAVSVIVIQMTWGVDVLRWTCPN